MNYKNHIGDGKLPNRYWVFHYDEQFMVKNGELILNNETGSERGGFLGEFKTFKDALRCVNTLAIYPHRVIEDRITGQVFESIVIVCPYCGRKEYKDFYDTKYTEEFMEKNGIKFE
jgi:hypothetical protein